MKTPGQEQRCVHSQRKKYKQDTVHPLRDTTAFQKGRLMRGVQVGLRRLGIDSAISFLPGGTLGGAHALDQQASKALTA